MPPPKNPLTAFLLQPDSLTLPQSKTLLRRPPLHSTEQDITHLPSFLQHPSRRPKPPTPANEKQDVTALEAALHPPKPKFVQADQSDWHHIAEANMTPELQRDLRIIENRQHLDPKRFYKSSGSGRKKGQLPTRVQLGTVVVGAHEFYSARLHNKERRSRIIDQVMSDKRIKKYTNNRFKALQQQRGKKRVIDPAAKRNSRRNKSTRW